MYVFAYIMIMSDSNDGQASEPLPTDAAENPIDAVLDSLSRSPKRANRMILTGAPAWVKKMIYLMHVARITEVRDWSRAMPTPQPQ